MEEEMQALEPVLAAWLLEDGARPPADPIPGSPLPTQVAQAAAQWRWWQQRERAYLRIAACVDPTHEFLFLMRAAIGRYLVPRTQVDFAGKDIKRVLFDRFWRAALAEAMFLTGVDIFLWARSLGQRVEAATAIGAEAVRRQIRTFFPLLVGMALHSPSQGEQTRGTIALAGWADSRISLKQNLRLAGALRQELAIRGEYYSSSRSKLREYLPANVYRAWYEGALLQAFDRKVTLTPGANMPTKTQEWKTLAGLLTRIAALVEHDVTEQSPPEFLPNVPLQAMPQPLDNPTYEEVARKLEEEDQYIAWVITEANLTTLEADVTRLKLQDPPIPEQEIADILGYRSLGSVKQAWLRARPKLKRIINQ
jgi:hypothetical protein